METTRKYPRTMNEAFPRTVEYANAVERHTPYGWDDKLVIWAGVIGFGLVGLMAMVGWIK